MTCKKQNCLEKKRELTVREAQGKERLGLWKEHVQNTVNTCAGYSYVNLTQAGIIREEGASKNMFPLFWAVGKLVGIFLN